MKYCEYFMSCVFRLLPRVADNGLSENVKSWTNLMIVHKVSIFFLVPVVVGAHRTHIDFITPQLYLFDNKNLVLNLFIVSCRHTEAL